MIIQICPHCGGSTQWTESNQGVTCSVCGKPLSFAEPDDTRLPDELNQMFELFGFEFIRTPIGNTPYSQAPAAPDTFFNRLFEPEPTNARLKFRPGDTVKLTRPDLFGWVPVGALGVVQELEPPESAMAEKGRHYLVKFDLTPYKIPFPPMVIEWAKTQTGENGAPLVLPEYQETLSQNFGVNDLELVTLGENWRDDYQHPYEYDRQTASIPDVAKAESRDARIRAALAKAFFKNSARPTPNRRPVKFDYEGLSRWFAVQFPDSKIVITPLTQIVQIGDAYNELDEAWVSLEITEPRFNFSAPARFIIEGKQ